MSHGAAFLVYSRIFNWTEMNYSPFAFLSVMKFKRELMKRSLPGFDLAELSCSLISGVSGRASKTRTDHRNELVFIMVEHSPVNISQ